MATLRFGRPAPNDPEQVTLQTRWGTRTAIDGNRFLKAFPFGFFVDAGAASTTVRAVGQFGSTATPNTVAGAQALISHPDSGALPNGINAIGWTNQQPYTQEGVLHLFDVMADATGGREIVHVAAPMQKSNQAGTLGWDNASWFGTPYDPGFHTQAQAETVAASVLAYYADHPEILGFSIRDDVATTGPEQEWREAAIAVKAMQDLDPRPTSCVWTDQASIDEAERLTDVRLLFTYAYPCGKYADNTPTAEGDFHRSTFTALPNDDFADFFLPVAAPSLPIRYYIGQTHKTNTATSSGLRYPTPREIRKMTWVAIGGGVKGIFWFCWTDNAGEWEGLGHVNSRARLDAVAEMAHRLTPNIRARLLYPTSKVADLFTATGGGTTTLPLNYPNAYISTLYDFAHDLTYCVVCNNDTAAANVTIDSATLSGSLRNLETGSVLALPATVNLPALDGTIFQHIPPAQTELELAMLTASDDVVTGMRWMRTNGLARTGVAGNGSYEYNVTTGTTAVRTNNNPVDDHDGNYGEAFKEHGLCLKYLRTHDASLIPDIEAQVQWHIDIERRLVAQRGEYWAGSAPYWIWPLATPSDPEFVGVGDPNINGGAGASITYNQGDVRVWSSIDQMHMVAHALYAYMYLLRNEPAITANTTLRADCLALISRMATFEASNASFFVPADQRVLGNLHQIAQGLTPTTNSGIVDADYSSTYKGQQFGNWQISNVESNVNPSSNIAIDVFMRAVMAPDSQPGGVLNFLRGQAMDMLASDIGQHDVDWHTNYAPPVGAYPTGWVLRAAAGDSLEYASPRTIASNNGYATDLHYVFISNSAARDGMTGRAPQRLVVLCLLALMDPTYNVPIEIAPDGVTVLRSVNIVDACNQWAETMAAHLPEPTTNCIRFMAPMHLGVTGSHPTNVIDSAFTGYWAMAVEMWHLVNSGADYTDYYPIGTW